MSVEEKLCIRAFRTDEKVGQITTLLHDAYRALAEMGFRYSATHQDDAVTARRLSTGLPLVAEWDGVVVGTATLYAPVLLQDDELSKVAEWYTRPGVFRFGQFGVRPDFQRRKIGSALLQSLEAMARTRGATELALDTAEGALHLRQWYDRLGFRFIQHASWSVTNYRSVILSKRL